MVQKKEKGIGMDGGAEYFSKDFEWEELKLQVEGDPSLQYHLLPFRSSSVISEAIESDSEAWKRFHIRHSAGKFFKERRYLLKEFPELVSGEECKVLEVGCGNGSTALPLLRGNENLIVYACDCSKEILERAKMMMNGTDIVSVEHRFRPFYCDLSKSGFPLWLACDSCQNTFPQKPDDYFPDIQVKDETHASDLYSSNRSGCCIGGVNFVTLIFTLSAIPLQGMPLALRECFSVLRPGSLLLFRDYGLYDMTMLRFEPNKRVGFREYVRSDGTRSYFFCLDTVRDLFVGAGFIELELDYCCVKSVNRRNRKSMQRVWVHGKFQKPIQDRP